jgi:hypothetical protein
MKANRGSRKSLWRWKSHLWGGIPRLSGHIKDFPCPLRDCTVGSILFGYWWVGVGLGLGLGPLLFLGLFFSWLLQVVLYRQEQAPQSPPAAIVKSPYFKKESSSRLLSDLFSGFLLGFKLLLGLGLLACKTAAFGEPLC